MIKIKKIAVILLASLLFSISAFAKEAIFKGADYDLNLRYNEIAKPGDAVFVKINFSRNSKSRVSKKEFLATTATLEFLVNGKTTRSSEFYAISKEDKDLTMLTGIPLSTWWTEETKCSLKVVYNLYGKKKMEFDLPFTLEHKDFVEEIIELNEQNTAIKTDTSTKRMDQIARLNAILETKNTSAIYQLSNFIAPTTATRRTSFFGDRRTFKYTTGKTSTNLHFGIDYGVPTGTKVTSCGAGRVVLKENRVSTGWSIVIEHLPGLYSLYYHMSETKVKEGDIVKPGQLIGLSGATGLATGPHLHWEIRLNMEAVSPDFFVENFNCEN